MYVSDEETLSISVFQLLFSSNSTTDQFLHEIGGGWIQHKIHIIVDGDH